MYIFGLYFKEVSMHTDEVSNLMKVLLILLSGWITLIMILFVDHKGGDRILVFVVTDPFHIFVSSIFAVIHSKVFVRRKIDPFYQNAYVMVCVFLLLVSAVVVYPYAG